jgi:probable HAF family extracellular repeat protein
MATSRHGKRRGSPIGTEPLGRLAVLALAIGVALVALFLSLSLSPMRSAFATTDENPFATGKLSIRNLGMLPGGDYSEAYAINDDGQVVGTSQTASAREHAFLWQDGKMRDLGTLGGRYSSAYAINNRGQVVGTSRTPLSNSHAVLWTR